MNRRELSKRLAVVWGCTPNLAEEMVIRYEKVMSEILLEGDVFPFRTVGTITPVLKEGKKYSGKFRTGSRGFEGGKDYLTPDRIGLEFKPIRSFLIKATKELLGTEYDSKVIVKGESNE